MLFLHNYPVDTVYRIYRKTSEHRFFEDRPLCKPLNIVRISSDRSYHEGLENASISLLMKNLHPNEPAISYIGMIIQFGPYSLSVHYKIILTKQIDECITINGHPVRRTVSTFYPIPQD